MSATVPEGFALRATRGGPRRWLARHLQAGLASLGTMARTPFATAMTIAVIGVALALPGALHTALANIDLALAGQDAEARITLFLRQDVADPEALALAERLGQRPEIRDVELTSKANVLEEYERMIGLDGFESVLGGDNPLPAVIDLVPVLGADPTAEAGALARILRQLDEVEMVRVDLEWIARLEALVALARRALWLLAGFLATAVVLVVGSTLGAAIDARREEIAVVRAFGGTDAFVRRPFLYSGASVGLGGGALAWVLVYVACQALDGPVRRVSSAYGSEYSLTMPGTELAGILGVGAVTLGLAGAFVAVGRHLRALDPG